MEDLIRLTARRAVELLKKGEVSPLELIDAAEARIARVDGRVNALPTLCLERARERAKAMMAEKRTERPPWHLHGLPVAIKDLEEVAGVRTTFGSPIFTDHVPDSSDLCVRTLEENGALVMAKSNTPEFGAGANTFNEVFGQTLNPWNTDLTCGGSSGGAAVALATGQAWLAQGSDMGGSLRIPASFCSVVGFRCSPGRVARGPQKTLYPTLSVSGPMGRNVADTALMLDAMVGFHPLDPLSLPRPRQLFIKAAEQPRKPSRVAFSPDLGLGVPVDKEVVRLCAKAAEEFQRLGAAVEETAPDLSPADEIFQTLRADAFVSGLEEHWENKRDLLKPEVVWNIEAGLKLTAREVCRAEKGRAELYGRVVSFFREYDLLLCPTVVCPPFDVNLRYLSELEGKAFETYISWLILTYALTITACPAISVPCGFTAQGLPVGLQMVGPPRAEATVISAAALYEEVFEAGQERAWLTPIEPRSSQREGGE